MEEGSSTFQTGNRTRNLGLHSYRYLMIPKCDLHIDATQHQLLVSVFTKGAKSDLPWDWVIVGVMEEWCLPHTMGRLACKIRFT